MSSLWCLYNLARHPEVQEKLHQEVISVLGEDGDVTPGSLAKMSYLKACVKESSRQVKCGSLQSSSLPSQIGFSSQLQRAELTSEPIIITNASGCICEKKTRKSGLVSLVVMPTNQEGTKRPLPKETCGAVSVD